MLSLLFNVLLILPPEPAAWAASILAGRPGIAPELVRICHRESRYQALGVHEVDAIPSRSSYWGQIKLGDRSRAQGHDKHLDRRCQAPPRDWRRWGTRGPWGTNAADMWKYLPRCYQPEVFDTPFYAAQVAVAFYLDKCDGKRDTGWCPRKRRRRRKRSS